MRPAVARAALAIALGAAASGCREPRTLAEAADAALRGRAGCVLAAELPGGRVVLDSAPAWSGERMFPPGSVFKIASACAFADGGAERRFCAGPYSADGREYECSLRDGHGWMGLESALAHSCNFYFRAEAARRPSSAVVDAATALGFVGARAVPALREEPPGTLAVGESPALSITPRAMLDMMARWGAPGDVPGVSPRARRLVQAGLVRCVAEGTGRSGRFADLGAAGKTGTASALDGSGATHGWFVGFVPAERPALVVAVFLERGRGADAAHVAYEVMSWQQRHGGSL